MCGAKLPLPHSFTEWFLILHSYKYINFIAHIRWSELTISAIRDKMAVPIQDFHTKFYRQYVGGSKARVPGHHQAGLTIKWGVKSAPLKERLRV
jgi:hypothetical protein